MKKFSEMDIAMMELQKIGNDEFMMGSSKHDKNAIDVIETIIKDLQNYLDENREMLQNEESEYGYRMNVEFFKKGEPKKSF